MNTRNQNATSRISAPCRSTSRITWYLLIILSAGLSGFTQTSRFPVELADRGTSTNPEPDVAVTRLSERILQLKVRAPGIFGTNVVVIATQKGLVVIDTWHSPFIFERIAEIAEQQFGRRDFAYVIFSHEDVDHASGGGLFRDITLVGHDNIFKALKAAHAGRSEWEVNYRGRIQGYIKGEEAKLAQLDPASKEAYDLLPGLKNLKKLDQDFERGFPILPDKPRAVVSFNDSFKIALGDVTVEAYACKAGHTPSDILIYIPEEAFLFTGDAAQVTLQKDVQMEQWLAQLERFARPDANVKTVLTGHADRPLTRQDLGSLRDYLRALWEAVRDAQRQGLSLEQIQDRYSLDNAMARFRSLAGDALNAGTLEQFRDKHRRNIERIFNLGQPR